jgi:hypothetical protein
MKNHKHQKTVIKRKNLKMRKGYGVRKPKSVKSHLNMLLQDKIRRELSIAF